MIQYGNCSNHRHDYTVPLTASLRTMDIYIFQLPQHQDHNVNVHFFLLLTCNKPKGWKVGNISIKIKLKPTFEGTEPGFWICSFSTFSCFLAAFTGFFQLLQVEKVKHKTTRMFTLQFSCIPGINWWASECPFLLMHYSHAQLQSK